MSKATLLHCSRLCCVTITKLLVRRLIHQETALLVLHCTKQSEISVEDFQELSAEMSMTLKLKLRTSSKSIPNVSRMTCSRLASNEQLTTFQR